jgi:hypothetical protein
MGISGGPYIVRDSSLVLELDAADRNSYPGTGTTWFDLCGNYNFTLTNSPVFTTHKGTPVFNFDGADDYATRAGSISHDIGSACTITIVMASINNTDFGSCSRLFSVNDGSINNVDYTSYFTLAACDQSRYGLWYRNIPPGLYPISSLKTANDDFKIVTYKWTASSNAFVFVNGIQESTSAVTSAFNFNSVGRMTIAANSMLSAEYTYIRVASVIMYNRELSASEIFQNYTQLKSRFNL